MPVSSGIPTESKFHVSLLSRGGWVVGGWGEIEIKAKLSPAKAGAWAELGKNMNCRNELQREMMFG